MSVLLETSLGDIVIDLLVEHAPKTCLKYVDGLTIPCCDFPLFVLAVIAKYHV